MCNQEGDRSRQHYEPGKNPPGLIADDNMDALSELQTIAVEALATLDTGHRIQPFSSRTSSFNLDDAYRVTATVRKMREDRGELAVGRKIGFTNRTAWVNYNVNEPMWGYVDDRTVRYLAEPDDMFSLMHLAEPRIEPDMSDT